jgi:DNA-binding beta-propeller fold protein YncE
MNVRLLIILALLTTGCAGPTAPETREIPNASIVWPQPPAQARIGYLYSFNEPLDLKIKPSFGRQIMNVLAGEERASLVRPYALSVHGDKILVADPGAKAVHLFDRKKRRHQVIQGAGDESLVSPVGVALGAETAYVTDSARGNLYLFDHKGQLLKTVSDLQRPTGLAYDSASGRLFVAETLAHRVVVFDKEGNRLFEFGARGTEVGEFNFPSHLFVSGDKLLVNDNMNFQIKTFTLDGHELAVFGKHGDSSGQFSQPKGVAADSMGNIYVAGATIDRIQIFSAEGVFLLAFGGEGNMPGNFLMPAGITIANDLIYVADSYNGRVQVFQFLGAD